MEAPFSGICEVWSMVGISAFTFYKYLLGVEHGAHFSLLPLTSRGLRATSGPPQDASDAVLAPPDKLPRKLLRPLIPKTAAWWG